MDDYLDMIERLFLDGDIDGVQMSLACAWLDMNWESPDVAPVDCEYEETVH